MNLSPKWIEWFAKHQLRAEHWSTIGDVFATDEEVMRYASAHEYVILTHDLDFSVMLAITRARRPSVVQIRADNISPEAIGDMVVSALRLVRTQLKSGALLTIEPRRSRLRLLPFLK